MPLLRAQLLKIQRTVYRKNLRRINETLTPDKAVARYAREYHKYLRHYEAVSSKAELIRHVMSSDIVYHGDYHPLKQSQRSVLRILREIAGKRQIILCLEMFHGNDQRLIDQYMHKELSRKNLFNKINYAKKWGYKWEYWKPVIKLCKQHDIQIIGINSEQDGNKNSLALRDIYSAKVIGKLLIRNPEALIYVVDGDYHVSPNHLPYQVEKPLKLFDIEVKRTIIYQNPANLYWQLADKNREENNVLHISSDSFCIMNTTPANKLQSYLNWLEFSKDAYYPVHADWEDASEELGNTSIPALTKTICTILGLSYPDDAMERLEIHYGTNLDFMGVVHLSPELAPQLPSVRQKIKNNEGFLLEYERNGVDSYLIYLPTSSLNMAAEEATHFLNALLRGRLPAGMKPFDAFYCTVMTEAIGFFGSKLINEKRKVQTRNSIRRYLGSFKQKRATREDQRKIHLCHLILQHRYIENLSHHPNDFKDKFKDLYRARTRIHGELATQLGYMLGDKLFYAVKNGGFPLKEVVELFKEPFSEPYKAFLTYLNTSSKIAQSKDTEEQGLNYI